MKGFFMDIQIILGIFMPFAGTVLGGSCVFFLKKQISSKIDRVITGFAGGIMTAASFFSLLIPAIEYSSRFNNFAFFPVSFGFALGIISLVLADAFVPHMHFGTKKTERCKLSKRAKLTLAVGIHNFPEGMAVGVVYASVFASNARDGMAAALALSVGIAIQNFPEGAIISLPLKAEGVSKKKAFLISVLSGIVEPFGAVVMLIASSLFLPILPYVLGFAAGTMIFAVVDDMMPAPNDSEGMNKSSVAFALGFLVMMILDVALK